MNYTQTKNRVYVDSKGTEYKEGDIVYNPCIGDYWVVRESIPTDNTVCPYQLLLWDSREQYFMDLDEPAGFTIIASKADKEYKKLLRKIHKQRTKLALMDFTYTTKYRVLKAIGKTALCMLVIFIYIFIGLWVPLIPIVLTTILIIIILFIYFFSKED